MNLLSERLHWAMQEESKRRNGKRVTKAELARVAGISDTSVGNWLKDEHGIDAVNARLVASHLQVNPLWLETGEGPVKPGDAAKAPQVTEKRLAPREQPFVHSLVSSYDGDDEVPEDVVLIPESRIEFAAGDGAIFYELVEHEEPASYRRGWFRKYGINPDKVKRFRVSGDSQEPYLFDRDTILVNMEETQIIDGRLYALRYGDQLRVKFLSRRIDGTLVLRSMNPAYKDEEVPPELAEEHIRVIGRVRDRSGTGGL